MTARATRLPPAESGPCSCGREAVRTIGRLRYCEPCAARLLGSIRASIASRTGIGFGEPIGSAGRGWPATFFSLACQTCAATWVGPELEECRWCRRCAERRGSEPTTAPPRYVPGVLRCDLCGQLFGDGRLFAGGPLLELSVCGVHGGPTTCNGRVKRVRV